MSHISYGFLKMERVIALDTYHVRSKRALKKGLEEYTSIRVIYGEAETIEWKIP